MRLLVLALVLTLHPFKSRALLSARGAGACGRRTLAIVQRERGSLNLNTNRRLLDRRALRVLAALPVADAVELLAATNKTVLRGVKNRSAWLTSRCRDVASAAQSAVE